jgi:hypothetical protein
MEKYIENLLRRNKRVELTDCMLLRRVLRVLSKLKQ